MARLMYAWTYHDVEAGGEGHDKHHTHPRRQVGRDHLKESKTRGLRLSHLHEAVSVLSHTQDVGKSACVSRTPQWTSFQLYSDSESRAEAGTATQHTRWTDSEGQRQVFLLWGGLSVRFH